MLAVCAGALLTTPTRAVAADDPAAIQFAIRFKAGRSTFHMGERIELELVFTPGRVKDHEAEALDGWDLAAVVFDRGSDVATPFQVLRGDLDWFGIPAGVPGCAIGGATLGPAPPTPPRILTLSLDARFRFDTPGRYRLHAQSRHHAPTAANTWLTSNVLDLEIAPRDETHDAAVLARATAVIDDLHSPGPDFRAALRDLRTLATVEAGRVLARLLERPDLRRDMDVRKGIFVVSDRAAMVEALRAELLRPERPVNGEFVRDLALLETARRHPGGPPYPQAEYLALIDRFSMERASALAARPGLLSGALREELTASGHWRFQMRGALATALHRFPSATTAAFRALPEEAQANLLLGSWRRFNHPVFLPLVRAAYHASLNGDAELHDIALRRLVELSPVEGRRALRAELRRVRLRASRETLRLLPDRALPGLDPLLLRVIEQSPDEDVVQSAAWRLARFGVATSLRPVRRLFVQGVDSLPCEAVSFLVAYIARVAPHQTDRAIRRVLDGKSSGVHCAPGLFLEVGGEHWSPEIERAAIAALRSAPDAVAADAARALGKHGSPDSRAPLEARLAMLGGAHSDASGDRRLLGWSLYEALVTSLSWTLTRDEYDRLWAGCHAASCGASFMTYDSHRDPSLSVDLISRADTGDLGGVAIGAFVSSLIDVARKLRQLPVGTRVRCRANHIREDSERWPDAERVALCERVQAAAAAHGVIVVRERL